MLESVPWIVWPALGLWVAQVAVVAFLVIRAEGNWFLWTLGAMALPLVTMFVAIGAFIGRRYNLAFAAIHMEEEAPWTPPALPARMPVPLRRVAAQDPEAAQMAVEAWDMMREAKSAHIDLEAERHELARTRASIMASLDAQAASLQRQERRLEREAQRLLQARARPVERPAHEVLGIAQDAQRTEARAAYRKLLKEYHPDRVPTTPEWIRDEATTRTQELTAAWHNLS